MFNNFELFAEDIVNDVWGIVEDTDTFALIGKDYMFSVIEDKYPDLLKVEEGRKIASLEKLVVEEIDGMYDSVYENRPDVDIKYYYKF